MIFLLMATLSGDTCNVFVNRSWAASEKEQNIGEDVDEILVEIFQVSFNDTVSC
jgi:hypothetical protein